MDERGGRIDVDDIDEGVRIRQENEEKLKAWEADRKAEAERREREEKQARLSDYLARRTQAWTDHTGTPPTSSMISAWRREYVEQVIADQELDLELRRAQAANDFPI